MHNNESLSVFIPRVFPNISTERIKHAFEHLKIGVINRIDLVPKTNQRGEKYNIAFIHLHNWCENIAALKFKRKVFDQDKRATLMYEKPWYWIILPSRSPARKYTSTATTNDNDESEERGSTSIYEHMDLMYKYLDYLNKRSDSTIEWVNYQHPVIDTLESRITNIESLLNIPPQPPRPPVYVRTEKRKKKNLKLKNNSKQSTTQSTQTKDSDDEDDEDVF